MELTCSLDTVDDLFYGHDEGLVLSVELWDLGPGLFRKIY